jgi:hypothetical protein
MDYYSMINWQIATYRNTWNLFLTKLELAVITLLIRILLELILNQHHLFHQKSCLVLKMAVW